jgi:hypothetical protein
VQGNPVKGMCHKSSCNRFHVLGDLSDGEKELDEAPSDEECHATLHIYFGDYVTTAMDKRGMNDKKSIRGHRKLLSQKCRGSSLGRETSSTVSEHRSIASLQHDLVGHANGTLENLDPGWFKIC